MLKRLDNGYLFVFLVVLAPTSFFLSRNYSQQSVKGNLLTLAAALLIGLVASVCAAVLLAFFDRWPWFRSASGRPFRRIAFAVASVVAFPFSVYISWWNQGVGGAVAMAVLAVLCVLYLTRIIGFGILNAFLAIFTVISLINLTRIEMAADYRPIPPPKAMPHKFALVEKPNIYYLFLESMHDRRTINAQYGFDAPELFSYLDDKKFVIVDDFYTNYVGTLESALAAFSMGHHFSKFNMSFVDATRDSFAVMADNNVFHILKHNGYSINLFDVNGKYVFRHESDFVDYTHFRPKTERIDGVAESIGYINPYAGSLIRWINRKAYGEPGGETLPMVNYFRSDYPGKFNLRRPAFFYFHFGARHIGEQTHFYPEPGWRPDWIPRYKDHFRRATKELQEFVDSIMANDPGALIVITGDHGASKYGRQLDLQTNPEFLLGKRDINAFFRENGVEPRTVGAALGEVLAAIHWPKGITPPEVPDKGLSHVTLFPFIFSRLGEKTYREEDFAENISVNLVHLDGRYLVFARDGKLLDDWKVMLLRDGRLVDPE